ncbi:MAG: N-acetyl sugar amidotransferase [Holosporaceae bacterium]|nr:N-acetyl sugar amidotransferase [Holosporaceae bacterium]
MKYCKKCLQPDTRPNIFFNDEGVCGACIYEQQKNTTIDWESRKKELESIVKEAKERAVSSNSPYDCVIGVSGGKDSHFQALYAKEKLGLRVLLGNGAPDGITAVGQHNIDNLCSQGFDLISLKPNPVIAKKLAKKAFFDTGNIVAPSEYALWSSAYIIADKFNIPLIIQGENAALTLGISKNSDTSGNALGVLNINTLSGCRADDLCEDGLGKKDLYMYDFPLSNVKEKNIVAIWLQYYAKEWSQIGNADFAVARGLLGRMSENLHDIGRYRRFSALDSDLCIPNQMIKYYKFGFGYATDEVCYDIREGRISREDAVWLVQEYDGKCGERYVDLVCDYLGITKVEFRNTLDKFVNRKLFEKVKGCWIPKFTVGVDFEEDESDIAEDMPQSVHYIKL